MDEVGDSRVARVARAFAAAMMAGEMPEDLPVLSSAEVWGRLGEEDREDALRIAPILCELFDALLDAPKPADESMRQRAVEARRG